MDRVFASDHVLNGAAAGTGFAGGRLVRFGVLRHRRWCEQVEVVGTCRYSEFREKFDGGFFLWCEILGVLKRSQL